MNDWVVQSFSAHNIDELDALVRGKINALSYPKWRTWVDEQETDRVMDPTTLEKAADRFVRYMEESRKYQTIWEMMTKNSKYRLFNVKTEEVIPAEVFGF